MSRLPSVDEMIATFCERWDCTPTTTDRMEAAMLEVRDLFAVGRARARARACSLERRRRITGHSPAPHLRLVAASADMILRVAAAGGVDVSQVIGQDRSKTASRVRFEAIWILRRARNLSWPEIGAVMRRTNSAAIRGVRIVDERAKVEPGLARRLRKLARSA